MWIDQVIRNATKRAGKKLPSYFRRGLRGGNQRRSRGVYLSSPPSPGGRGSGGGGLNHDKMAIHGQSLQPGADYLF